MMVTCLLGILFESISSGNIVASSEFGNEELTTYAAILRDGRIYAAATDGHCAAFQVPETIRDVVKRCAGEVYKEPGAVPTTYSKRASSNDEDVETRT